MKLNHSQINVLVALHLCIHSWSTAISLRRRKIIAIKLGQPGNPIIYNNLHMTICQNSLLRSLVLVVDNSSGSTVFSSWNRHFDKPSYTYIIDSTTTGPKKWWDDHKRVFSMIDPGSLGLVVATICVYIYIYTYTPVTNNNQYYLSWIVLIPLPRGEKKTALPICLLG